MPKYSNMTGRIPNRPRYRLITKSTEAADHLAEPQNRSISEPTVKL